ncbi:ferrous iron transport protein B [Granulicella cerasi]|uniref:Ferrous iron transport protein B n=1 Tax=Granulicella cerasi TaxID=741063 RepID=A0ABW1ZC63_9BACT|nr:ferrous iron transport protein B [Granulicella cerasi]
MSCHVTAAPEIPIEPIEEGKQRRIRTVALVGPPNCGKSTLFNRLTGLRQKTANYPGVTVDHHSGKMKGIGRADLTLIDLPGIYSLATYSEDARVAVDVLTGRMPGVPAPDVVLLVLDAVHMNRQLMLAQTVFSLGLPTMVLLNMSDLLEERGGKVDPLALSAELGHPVALISSAKGRGLDLISAFIHQTTAETVEHRQSLRLPVLQPAATSRKWAAQVSQRTQYRAPEAPQWTRRLDAILLHRIWGPIIFLMVVIAVFQVVFSLGQPLSDAFGDVLTKLGAHVANALPDNWLRPLLRDGLWNGVQSVLVFLPQILLLFLFIGILEDSGYLARAALIADRVMRVFGLNGKAFIPLLSAYACAVPAIMATRTIENKRERIATILVAPFMTCSARLPIYTLIIAAFVPDKRFLGSIFGLRAAVMLGLYALGFFAALFTARMLKSSVLRAQPTPFVLELPQYRWPTLRGLALRLYDRAGLFLKKAGTIILGATFVVWLLSVLPVHGGQFSEISSSIIGHIGHFIEPIIHPLGFNWKIGIGLLSSIVAREVIVGTLGTLYGVDPATHAQNLQLALHHDMTVAGAIALVVFFAFAMQCTSTLAIVKRETNSIKFPLLQFCYMTGVAYIAALLTNQLLMRIL